MLPEFNRVKGVHPGAVLKRELKKRSLKSIELAKSINEHPQTINAITKERRGINPKLSIKLGEYFGIEKDYFMLLQASYEVKKSIRDLNPNPLIGKIRKSIFWDTDIKKIDIVKNKRFIIQRILERGNKTEIQELIHLYNTTTIKKELKYINNSFNPSFKRNVSTFIK
ncbi:MAG: helix-turn-helix domain-containing protein [Bacteroidota bacterium]